MSAYSLESLEAEIVVCARCPRLVAWRERVAAEKRAAYRSEVYWGRPVPGFGDPGARVVVVGLAPAAHGANRTGRMFTGDRSGDWLFRALYRAGFASAPVSIDRHDGLTLHDTWITAPVRCAPPANEPTAAERTACAGWLDAELDLLAHRRLFVVLGRIGYHAVWAHLRRAGSQVPVPRPKFGHGAVVDVDPYTIIMSYHPSQQNTFTGRLTEDMLDVVFERARETLDGPGRR